MSMSGHVLTHNILYHHIPATTLPPAHLWTKHVAPWFIFCFHDGANTQWYAKAPKISYNWPLPRNGPCHTWLLRYMVLALKRSSLNFVTISFSDIFSLERRTQQNCRALTKFRNQRILNSAVRFQETNGCRKFKRWMRLQGLAKCLKIIAIPWKNDRGH